MKLWKDRKGSMSILLIGFLLLLLLLVFLVMEYGAAYFHYEQAEDILQRAVNSAVESSIRDEYRADKILLMDLEKASASFRNYVNTDFPKRYKVRISSMYMTNSPPTMKVTGTVTIPTLFSQYGFGDITFQFSVQAQNYDLK